MAGTLAISRRYTLPIFCGALVTLRPAIYWQA